jgi:hypothetical protein
VVQRIGGGAGGKGVVDRQWCLELRDGVEVVRGWRLPDIEEVEKGREREAWQRGMR